MDNFLDNQAVTVDMLNNIAVDLGAAGFAAFGEDKFGVDELNGITQALVTEGILNTGNGCRAVKSGESISIQDGIIVFESGAKKKIEEAVTLELMNNAYIYALNNTTQNQIQLIVSQTQPTEGDYVMIAQTDADGELIDKREFAVGKYAPKAGNIFTEENIELSFSGNSDFTYDLDVGWGGFNYVLTPYGHAYVGDGEERTIKVSTSDYKITKITKNGSSLHIVTHYNGSGGPPSTIAEFTFV